jgi:hypothetical protein
MAECLECVQQALTIAPGWARARYELACVHLQMGDYLEGFREYDSRWERRGFRSQPTRTGHCWVPSGEVLIPLVSAFCCMRNKGLGTRSSSSATRLWLRSWGHR